MASVGSAILPLRGLVYIVRHRVFPVQSSFMPLALNAAGSLAFLLALYTKCVPQLSPYATHLYNLPMLCTHWQGWQNTGTCS